MGNSGSHRRKHRQQSHHQSHAEATVTPVLQGHPLVPTEEADWVENDASFQILCQELSDSGLFSFDTEFIGEDTFYPKTCLVQVATKQKVTLIDPFKIQDLTPLFELIANPDIITLLHSGSQDLEPVAQLLGKPPAAIFDTQIAAGLIGFPWPISLTKMIETILGHDVGGHFTFSQWDARPLSNRQRLYAADDVRYLIAVYEHLVEKLEKLDRITWAEEEFSKSTSMEAYDFNLLNIVKRICKNKSPRKKELVRIQALATVREEIAIDLNLPTRAIIPNECIITLAKKPVETCDQLALLKGFSKNIAFKFGNKIIQAIEQSSTLEPLVMRKPHPIERESQTRQELDGAWSLFGAWCVGKQLSLSLVTNRPIFTDWYLALREGKQLTHSPLLSGWRSEAIDEFAAMIQGKAELTFSYNEVLHVRKTNP